MGEIMKFIKVYLQKDPAGPAWVDIDRIASIEYNKTLQGWFLNFGRGPGEDPDGLFIQDLPAELRALMSGGEEL
jgi:hypothetical protein